jgi:hypothetical protein
MSKIVKNIVNRHFLREEYIPRQRRTSISRIEQDLYPIKYDGQTEGILINPKSKCLVSSLIKIITDLGDKGYTRKKAS